MSDQPSEPERYLHSPGAPSASKGRTHANHRLVAGSLDFEQVGEGPDIVWVSGGGGLADDWDPYQLPYFKHGFRNTTFDNRGIGTTECTSPLPWTLADFARDTAELIRSVNEPPVALVGLSLGGAIVQQVAIDYPDLIRVAIPMGTGTWSVEWGRDYQMAEVEFHRGHCSIYGHTQDILNAYIKELIERYL